MNRYCCKMWSHTHRVKASRPGVKEPLIYIGSPFPSILDSSGRQCSSSPRIVMSPVLSLLIRSNTYQHCIIFNSLASPTLLSYHSTNYQIQPSPCITAAIDDPFDRQFVSQLYFFYCSLHYFLPGSPTPTPTGPTFQHSSAHFQHLSAHFPA